MKTTDQKTIRQLLDEGAVLKALERGSRRAVKMHKLLGNPIAIWRDDKVVWIPPEEIQVEDHPEDMPLAWPDGQH
ncbi:MAG: hypothetical protein FWD53_09385 [Phycisphaerales bacterium]|nr:hypothetical protein [Phycisphaerales bacterium]